MVQLHVLDIIVIALFFAIIFSIAIYYSRKGSKDTGQFFLSGRNLPWYIAGTAMVATTFAADTPLAVTELVAKNGIAGNWLWWNMAIGTMLTVFFFSRLWRRSEMMTDVELIEFRYGGWPAAILRGFKAIYLGLFMNAIVMGWVHKAMEKIFSVVLPGLDPFLLVIILAIIITIYASASGLVGTSRTDSIQFVFAMVGCIILAIIVLRLPQIKGSINLKEQLKPEILSFIPKVTNKDPLQLGSGVFALTVGALIAYVGIQWWSSWYPGADPGGGGYIAQRMMSAKDEKHSFFATLWFTIAHFTVRPWPWILVALAALVILPRAESTDVLRIENPKYYQIASEIKAGTLPVDDQVNAMDGFADFYEKYENTVDPGVMYPKLMVKYLPVGLLGLLLAVFLAAYMSTIASQLNWGTSYLINDFYKRFFNRNAKEKHYVHVSKFAMFIVIIFSLVLTRFFITRISDAWEFIINASAGMGAVLILRWYWWRINAWSEITAMVAPLIIYPLAHYKFGIQPPYTLYPTVIGTTFCWLIVTWITAPEKTEILQTFYNRVKPGGNGWRKFRFNEGIEVGKSRIGRMFINWMLGIILVYSFLFSIGKLLFGEILLGGGLLALGILVASILWRNIKNN
ncbi:MAG: Na+:solute symporter [Bacteroidales bacterium]|nr:Na+:solute symporter [Bacteroidales bacterium]